MTDGIKNGSIFDPAVEDEYNKEETDANDGHLEQKASYDEAVGRQLHAKTLADSQNIVGRVYAYPDIENMKNTFMYQTIAMAYHPPLPDGSRPQITPYANWIIIEGDGREGDDGSVWVAWYDNEIFHQQIISFLYWDKAYIVVPPRKLVPIPGKFVPVPPASLLKLSVAPNPIYVWNGLVDDFKTSSIYKKYAPIMKFYPLDKGGRAPIVPKKDNMLVIMFQRSKDVFGIAFKSQTDFNNGVDAFKKAGAVSNTAIGKANIAYHKKLIAEAVQHDNDVKAGQDAEWEKARETAETAIYNQNHKPSPKTAWEAFGEGAELGIDLGIDVLKVAV